MYKIDRSSGELRLVRLSDIKPKTEAKEEEGIKSPLLGLSSFLFGLFLWLCVKTALLMFAVVTWFKCLFHLIVTLPVDLIIDVFEDRQRQSQD